MWNNVSNDAYLIAGLGIILFLLTIIGSYIWKKKYWTDDDLDLIEIQNHPDGFSPSNAWMCILAIALVGSVSLMAYAYQHPQLQIH